MGRGSPSHGKVEGKQGANVLKQVGIVLMACLLAIAGANQARSDQDRFHTVIVDAGHGGKDLGARGVSGLLEKELVLDLANRLAAKLRGEGIKVIMTRDDDSFVSLEDRTNIANDVRGDLFVSIHANAAETGTARGIEVYFLSLQASDAEADAVASRENESFASAPRPVSPLEDDPMAAILGDLMMTDELVESNEFAKLAQAKLAKINPVPSRGVKQAPFVVLMGVHMPASLVEVGFVTNEDEEKELKTDARRESIASSLSNAILEYRTRYNAKRGVTPIRVSAQH